MSPPNINQVFSTDNILIYLDDFLKLKNSGWLLLVQVVSILKHLLELVVKLLLMT